MCAFVVLGLVFSYQAKTLSWGRLRNDLFCVEWDVKFHSTHSAASRFGDDFPVVRHRWVLCAYDPLL